MTAVNRQRQKMVADAIWQTIVLAYQDPGNRSDRVPIPQTEAANALLTCLANLIAQIADPNERLRIMQRSLPALDRAVNDIRRRAGSANGVAKNILIPPDGFSLPN